MPKKYINHCQCVTYIVSHCFMLHIVFSTIATKYNNAIQKVVVLSKK